MPTKISMPTKMLLIGAISFAAVSVGGAGSLSAQVYSHSNAFPHDSNRYQGLPPGSIILSETILHENVGQPKEIYWYPVPVETVYPAVPAITPIPTPVPDTPEMRTEVTEDDDSDPNDCLRPGSESWDRMVELIRENARLEAAVGKAEEIAEIRQEILQDRLEQLKTKLAEQEVRIDDNAEILERRRLTLAERAVQVAQQAETNEQRAKELAKQGQQLAQAKKMVSERLTHAEQSLLKKQKEIAEGMRRMEETKAVAAKMADKMKAESAKVTERINELESQLGIAQERADELAEELATSEEHLESARKREQAWKKERERMQQELKKGRKRS